MGVSRFVQPRLSAFKGSDGIQIGPSEAEPILYIAYPKKLFGSKPLLEVRTAPGESSPPIAVVEKGSKLSSRNTITLPAHHNQEIDFKPNSSSGGGWKTVVHVFSMDVGGGQKEEFHWKMTSDSPTSEYGSWGYHLLRTTSGASELVAIIGLGGSLSSGEQWSLGFLGQGATGAFGEAWEVAVVASAARVQMLDDERAVAATTSLAASAGTSAAIEG